VIIEFVRRFFSKHWLLILGAMAGGVLFAWSGLYDVAASSGHWAVSEWFLRFALRSSVRTHSLGLRAPALDDPALIHRGAGHFVGGCGPCHGTPHGPAGPIVAQLLPRPPTLTSQLPEWSREELFFIVMNGLKYTGMPGWVSPERGDEVWAMVAFLTKLPGMTADEFSHLAFGEVRDVTRGGAELVQFGPYEGAIAACARCHGLDGSGAADGAFPKIGGQSEAYLLYSLNAYADDRRPSGIMQPVAAALDADERREVARYYASASAMIATREGYEQKSHEPRLVARGAEIVARGMPETGVPPCGPCHSAARTDRNPLFPALDGQYANYIKEQLALWRKSHHRNTPLAKLMATIGERLSAEDAKAVAAYYSSVGRLSDDAAGRPRAAAP
jgi:cytochrome c553